MIDAPDFPAGSAKTNAQLGLFAGNQIFAVTAARHECGRTHQRIATAVRGFADGRVPFHVCPQMVDIPSRINFASPTANDGDIRMLPGKSDRRSYPAVGYLAVAVDELN